MEKLDGIERQETSTTPLVDWKNPPTIGALQGDFLAAKAVHDAQMSKVIDWRDARDLTGNHAPKKLEGRSSVAPRMIRKHLEWRASALTEPFLSTRDVFNVNPITWEDRDAAIQNELLLNHQFNTSINKVRFLDDYIRAAISDGTVIVRLGWEHITKKEIVHYPNVSFMESPEHEPMHTAMANMSPEEFAQVPHEMQAAHKMSDLQGKRFFIPQHNGYAPVEQDTVVKNGPTLEVCNLANVMIDPTCLGDIDKAQFIIYSFNTNLAALKADGRYSNLDQINVQGNTPVSDPYHNTPVDIGSFQFTDKPRAKFVVYEYWGYWDIDGSGETKAILVSWVGNTIIRMEENPFPDKKLPFVVVPYLPVIRSVYGESDSSLLIDNQRIVGAVTRGMVDIMGRSANGQIGMRKDMLDTVNRARFMRGEDYEFNMTTDPRQGVYTHTFPEIPASAQIMLQMQNAEAESLSGVKAFNQGISGAALGDVATGIRGALDAASKRELSILRRLSQGIIEIGHKMIAMNAVWLSEEEVVRVTNDNFVTVRRDDLPGNFDLAVSISTAEEDTNKAQELAFMLQTMGNSMDAGFSRMILAKIARLHKMPDLAEEIKRYQPQPDPMQQQQVMLQMQLMQAQLMKTQAEAAVLQSQVGVNEAKAGLDNVKQGHVQSEKDLKDLAFIEQQNGVNQERAIQLEQVRHAHQVASQAVNIQSQEAKHQYDLMKAHIQNQNKPPKG